ncbi:hypothetical protein IMSHALPRED_004475 [Imshaugia aleurites]|uniref:DUF7923 domain-containing protein n=1 Tax=Imshaugia aleurites TaxID=172621 RepID=A0A8H3PKI6_9LECA|nr:hypothetical protein IMSHALPRED_004475 [Imshaugia aleurites]
MWPSTHANGQRLIPRESDARKLFPDFLRGFNGTSPLSIYEDTSISGPSSAGDILLKQLRDNKCVKVIVAKRYGPGFQAMIKAQRQNGTLPGKLTEIILCPEAAKKPYPFTANKSCISYENPTQTTSAQTTSTSDTDVQSTSAQIISIPDTSVQTTSLPNTSTQIVSHTIGGAHAEATQTNTTPAGPEAMIYRNTLKLDDRYTDGPFRAGCRAAETLRTLAMERLSSNGIQLEESLEERIQIFANSQNLLLAKRDENEMKTLKNLFTDFVRGFNTHHPLSIFEDTNVTGPSGAEDALLGQLKDSNCTQIIVRKPYGPGFHALLQAQRQRQSGSLPAKLTEVMVHPQALHPPQSPYPFIAMPSLSGEASPKRTNPTQHSSGQNVSTQNVPVQKVSRQTHILQEVSTQTKLPQKVPTQTHLSQKNLPLTHFPQSLHTDKVSANRAHADPCPVDEASPESLSADTHTQDVPTQ